MTVALLLEARLGSRMLPPRRKRVLLRVRQWLEENAGHLLIRIHCAGPQEPAFDVELYPALGFLNVVALGRGRLRLSARTSDVGPGFHVWLTRLTRALGIDLKLRWFACGGLDAAVFGDSDDELAIERAMLDHAQAVLGRSLDDVDAAEPGRTRLEKLPSGEAFATALGPRRREELEAWRDDPLAARSLFPWWERGHDARYYLNRALVTMWLDVVWRSPENERELATMQHAHQMLLMARSNDPELALPWSEWCEILGYLGIQGSVTIEVAREAVRHGGEPRIGYRRQAE